MLKFQAQVYRIKDILGWHERKELVLSPNFQRRTVWSPQGKSYLIDSIVRGFPLPQFFIRERILSKERRTIREVVAGQQRLRTIIDFVYENFTIMPTHNKEFGKITFSNLPEEVQQTILSFPLTVNILFGTDDADVLGVFSRLNSYSLPVNKQELLNAEYLGVFKQRIDELARIHLEYWRTYKILSEREIARMREVQLTAQLIGVMLKGIRDDTGFVEGLYKEYDKNFPEYDYLYERFNGILELIKVFLADNLAESEFKRPPLFYSIFAALYDLQYGFCSSGSIIPNPLDRTKLDEAQQELFILNEAIAKKEPDSPVYDKFVDATKSSTNKLKARTIRHEILLNILSDCFIKSVAIQQEFIEI